MSEKTIDEIVEETKDKIEVFLSAHLSPKYMAIHNDIVTMYQYLEHPDKQSKHSTNQAIEAMARCRPILEYGDRIIIPIKPIYEGHIFGAN